VIKSIEIVNFQSHGSTRLDLDPNVNAVIGETSSGKTSVLRALNWVMTNRPRGTEDIQPKGKKREKVETRVTVTTDRGIVSRVRKKGFNGYEVTVGSAEEPALFTDVNATVPPEVLQVLNLGDLNVQDQAKPIFLIDLPAGQISKYISSELGFEVVDLAVAKGKSNTNALLSAKTTLDTKLESITGQVEVIDRMLDGDDGAVKLLEHMDNIQQDHRTSQETSSKIATSVSSLETLQLIVDTCQESVAKYRNADQDIQSVRELVDAIGVARDLARRMQSQLNAVQQLEDSIAHWKIKKVVADEWDGVSAYLKEVVSTSEVRAKLDARIKALSVLEDDVKFRKGNLDLAVKLRDAAIETYQTELSALGVCPYCGSAVLQDNVDRVLKNGLSLQTQ
jgi:DNA repair exonuclease SbcCD ATPase subunit